MVDSRTPIIAFLPCRRGSERVKFKNTRSFANVSEGLISIKISQLLKCEEISKIIVSTDDRIVAETACRLGKDHLNKVEVVERPDFLAASETSTDDLIKYVPDIINSGDILWTHVTSPFVDENVYANAIHAYQNALLNKTHDSLMSVTALRKFIWNSDGPVNYDRNTEKWPRTQTLEPLYEINSGIFIASREIYLELNDRIGKKVYLYELNSRQAFDVDWEEDFVLAEKIWLEGRGL